MNNKNEVFEYLIDQLRQQVNNDQCEDLAHEVLSLKNQLRDTSELVDELLGTITLMNGDTVAVREMPASAAITGDSLMARLPPYVLIAAWLNPESANTSGSIITQTAGVVPNAG